MHTKGAPSDGFRISVSSLTSTSSHGSAQDDFDPAGDVYVWGELLCDRTIKNSADKYTNPSNSITDILLPKPIEANVVLDAHLVACGVRHAALVSRQGELFTWGEESGGCLGHAIGTDVVRPCLLESMSALNVEYVSCGEFHTCAVTATGELYTWGDGTHNAGILGHGTNVSHWIPKRVLGPLEGLQVSYVSCGVWHTAVITTAGQLFTFGDGTFGVLGHGDRESILYPREVESLEGLKTIAVSCGVWHTAAIVEVIMTQSSASSGKLFTWGDGDKYRLGHGDKESRLKPTCVSSLIDHNFHKLSCGHSLTIGLSTSGQVFAMGSTVYGQLGNPSSDGKLPCIVGDRLADKPVGEVACGSYHAAVLTIRGEVYTWGKGASGRLGHGDIEDRKTPTLVEFLKDRPVKHIFCGSNFTAAICQHKWVTGAEQSFCSACRQPFGFTRKRHNCYNCGLIHCHQCSSRKVLRAALSPNPARLYRVCDSCYEKLSSGLECGGYTNMGIAKPWLPGENKDKFDRENNLFKASLSSSWDLSKNLDKKTANGKHFNSMSIAQTPKGLSGSPLKNVGFPGRMDMFQAAPRLVQTSVSKSVNHSRALSPFSRRPSPLRSTTPTPTVTGLSFSKISSDCLKKTNYLLNEELRKLHAELESLQQRCECQNFEMQKAEAKVIEAMTLVSEESAKSKAAKEVIKSLTAQLKEMAERLPYGIYGTNTTRPMHFPNGLGPLAPNDDSIGSNAAEAGTLNLGKINETPGVDYAAKASYWPDENSTPPSAKFANANLIERKPNPGEMQAYSSRFEETDSRGTASPRTSDDNSVLRSPSLPSSEVEAEWIEQFEPGVYITLVTLRDGTRDLKRVRFSRRRFEEHQAEAWWSENRERVYEKYILRAPDRTSSAMLS